MAILYFLISLFSSTIGAISGIGGGVIIKPVLDATGTLGVSAISFLSGCTVLTMAIVSLLRSRNNGVKIDKNKSTFLAIGSALGGVLGKWIFDAVKRAFEQESQVGAIQAILLLIITIGVFIYIKKKSSIKTLSLQNPALCFAIGLALGLISAFLGIGGGPINIAVLYFFFSMEAKTAARNSIYIILFSQITSFLTTVLTHNIPEFPSILLVFMIAGGILGGLIGTAISKRITDNRVEQVFTVLLVVIMGINVYNIFQFLG